VPEEKPNPHVELLTSTEGRQRFPDIMQDVYGDKAKIVGFHRYGRGLGSAVSLEAIRMLAGHPDKVDPQTRARIRESARAILAEQKRRGIRS
jgi:hypothetical protein